MIVAQPYSLSSRRRKLAKSFTKATEVEAFEFHDDGIGTPNFEAWQQAWEEQEDVTLPEVLDTRSAVHRMRMYRTQTWLEDEDYLSDALGADFPEKVTQLLKKGRRSPERILIGVQAPQGVGKTHILKAVLEPFNRVVVVSNRRRLITQIAKRLDVADYQEHEATRWANPRLAICLNSVRLAPARSHETEILVIDEAVGTLADLANGSHVGASVGERNLVFQGMEELAHQAEYTVLSDANLDLNQLLHYARLFGFQHVVQLEFRRHNPQRGTAVFMARGEAQRQALRAVESAYANPNEHLRVYTAPVIQCTSKKLIAEFAAHIRTHFPGMPVTEITSDTKNEAAVRGQFAPPGVVLASPSVDAGVDWHLPPGVPRRQVFFLDSHADVNVRQALQMMNRCRWTKQLTVGLLTRSWKKGNQDQGPDLKPGPSAEERAHLIVERTFQLEADYQYTTQGLARLGTWVGRDMRLAKQLAKECVGSYGHLALTPLERTSAYLKAVAQIESPMNGHRGALLREALLEDGYHVEVKPPVGDLREPPKASEEEPRRQLELEIQDYLRSQSWMNRVQSLLDRPGKRVSTTMEDLEEIYKRTEPTNWDLHRKAVREAQDRMVVSNAERELYAEVLLVAPLVKRIQEDIGHLDGHAAGARAPEEHCRMEHRQRRDFEDILEPAALVFENTVKTTAKHNPYTLTNPDQAARRTRRKDTAEPLFHLSPAALDHLDEGLRLIGYLGRPEDTEASNNPMAQPPRIPPRRKDIVRAYAQDLGSGWGGGISGAVLHRLDVAVQEARIPLGAALLENRLTERWCRKHVLPLIHTVSDGLPESIRKSWKSLEEGWIQKRARTGWRTALHELTAWLYGVPLDVITMQRLQGRVRDPLPDESTREGVIILRLKPGALWALDRLLAKRTMERIHTASSGAWKQFKSQWDVIAGKPMLTWEGVEVEDYGKLAEAYHESIQQVVDGVLGEEPSLLHARFGHPKKFIREISKSPRAMAHLERWRLIFYCLPAGHPWREEGIVAVERGLSSTLKASIRMIESTCIETGRLRKRDVYREIDKQAVAGAKRLVAELDIVESVGPVEVPPEHVGYEPEHGPTRPMPEALTAKHALARAFKLSEWYMEEGGGGLPTWYHRRGKHRHYRESTSQPRTFRYLKRHRSAFERGSMARMLARLPGQLSESSPQLASHHDLYTHYALFAANRLAERTEDAVFAKAFGDVHHWLRTGAPVKGAPELDAGVLHYLRTQLHKEQESIARSGDETVELIPADREMWRPFPKRAVGIHVQGTELSTEDFRDYRAAKEEEIYGDLHSRYGAKLTPAVEMEAQDEITRRLQLYAMYQRAAHRRDLDISNGEEPKPFSLMTVSGRTHSNKGLTGQRVWSIGSSVPGTVRKAITPEKAHDVWVSADVKACVPTLLLYLLGETNPYEDPYDHPIWKFPSRRMTREQRKYLLLKNIFGQKADRLQEGVNAAGSKKVSLKKIERWQRHLQGLLENVPEFKRLRSTIVEADLNERRWADFTVAGIPCRLPLKKDKSGRNAAGRALSLLLFGLEAIAINLSTLLLATRHKRLVDVGLYDGLLLACPAAQAPDVARQVLRCMADGFKLLGVDRIQVQVGWARCWDAANVTKLASGDVQAAL